jgi:hypothetical protein
MLKKEFTILTQSTAFWVAKKDHNIEFQKTPIFAEIFFAKIEKKYTVIITLSQGRVSKICLLHY